MPRDASGNYTLPAGNPVVTLTTISSVWANNTLSDIATALTASLSAPLLPGNGMVARTSASTFAARTLTGTANKVTVTNGDGQAGNPTFTLPAIINQEGIQFPATQVPSADANCLDDYEEGTWTVGITFDTPGNLTVAYGFRTGTYTKIGRMVAVQCTFATSTFTHTTASGSCRITGFPFNNGSSLEGGLAIGEVRGFLASPAFNATVAIEMESGSGAALLRYNNFLDGTSGPITIGEAPTGVSKAISFYGVYFV